MSHIVKCSRLVSRYCAPLHTSVTRTLATTEQNSGEEKQQNSGEQNSGEQGKIPLASLALGTGGGFAAAYGVYMLMGFNAKAKEEDDEDEDDEEEEEEEDEEQAEMEAAIDEALSNYAESDGFGDNDRFAKWASVQERYLLLSQAKRDQVELRDVTSEELAECDELYHNGKYTDMEDKLVELNTVSPHNDEVLWRLARLKWVCGKGYQSNQRHKVFHVAHALACQAAEINPDNGNAHRWIAILTFHKAEKEGVAATCLALEGIKYHLDKAVELNPEDSVAWSILGNWYFEVADMNRLQRRWMKTFAGVAAPEGTYKQALACFEKSHDIKPWIQNSYMLAKTHLRMGNKDSALDAFERLSKSTITTAEDFRVRKESHIYLQKLGKPDFFDRIRFLITPSDKYRIPFVARDTETTYNRHWSEKFWKF